MLRIPHCIHSRFTGGDEVGTGRALLPRNIIFLLLVPQGLVRLEGFGNMKKLILFIGPRDLPDCNITCWLQEQYEYSLKLSCWRTLNTLK
jgi:hypothetical protein